MNQTLAGRVEPLRSAAPTDARTQRYLLVLAAALLAGGVVVWQLRQPWAKGQLWPWLGLLVVMFAAAQALARLDLWLPGDPILPKLAKPRSAPMRWFGLFEIVFALLLTVLAVRRLWIEPRDWEGVPMLWAEAMLLFFVGAWCLGAVGRGSPRAATGLSLWADTPRSRWLEAAAVALIFLLAVFLRTYRLDAIPPGIYVDETNGGMDALYLLEGRPASPFGSGWYGTPNGYIYYMAGMLKLFGANWLGLKAISLLPALLTVPAVYLLGRLMFGPLAGLCAMLLMAASRWHLSMSRWGWNETVPPLFQVLAAYFLLRGLRDRRAADYALGGLLAGLSIYTYLSARLALATLALFLLYWFLSDPGGLRGSIRRSWAGAALFLVGLFVAAAPIGVGYVQNPFSFSNRTDEISVLRDIRWQGSLEPLAQNIGDMLKFFHQTGDHQGKHNLPDEPMVDPITGLLFAVGLAYALLARHDQRRVLLLMWLVIGMAGSFLSSHAESPQSYRSLTALPAVILLAAATLDQLARAAYRFTQEQAITATAARRSAPLWAAGGLVLMALSGSAAWEASTYFGRQAASVEVLHGFNPTENAVAREVIPALLAGKEVYLSPRFSEFSPLRFLVYGVVKAKTGQSTLNRPPYQVLLPEAGLPLPDHARDVLILLDSYYWPLRDYMTLFYPQAQMELVRLPDGLPLYMRITLPGDQIAALQGLTQTISYADGRTEQRTVTQVEWPAASAPASQVVWEGTLRLEHGGEYEFNSQGGLEFFLDDNPVQGKLYLGRGLYQLRAIAAGGAAGARLTMRAPDQAAPTPIPVEDLFRVSGLRRGLLGSYWSNQNWQGAPVFQQITPFLLLSWPDEQPLGSTTSFSARFTGLLQIDQPDVYRFRVEADDGARLFLDGELLGEGVIPGQPNSFDAAVDLQPGQHTFQIDYFQLIGGTALRLYWARGQEPWSPVPPAVLTPAEPEPQP